MPDSDLIESGLISNLKLNESDHWFDLEERVQWLRLDKDLGRLDFNAHQGALVYYRVGVGSFGPEFLKKITTPPPPSRSQKAWSGLSPTRNPVHLRLWGLSFPSVESQLESLFLFLF